MERITNYIYEQVANQKMSQVDAKTMLMELKGMKKVDKEDIAIIGMACKLPGARNIEEYWSNLLNGVVCISDYPEGRRKDSSVLLNKSIMKFLTGEDMHDSSNPDEVWSKGGFLDEIDKFDAGFFRIPPKEAKFMDPIQRLFLETAWESIEDAGYCSNDIYDTKTGVFVGRDYTPISLYKFVTEPDNMHLTGSWTGILASRISYLFNLRGPSMVIDTACSSGLVSIHEACAAIRKNECDMAIAGGINLNYAPIKMNSASMDMSMVESDSSVVKTFDKNANGTVWGEGVCVVFLKPLSKALADGDNIHAVIKGSAINNDGASNGITAPNADAQEDVILRAWEEAGINPETITYTEAHGTGTVLGDPIEIKGLSNSFRRFTDRKQFCGIGSAKTSIGHTVAASGVAAAFKVILSMKNGKIPASLNFKEPNPYINFSDSPVYVNDKLADWETNGFPKRGGVSSFGFSGTNCYVLLEEAPQRALESGKAENPNIFTISARSEKVLRDYIRKYSDFVDRENEFDLDDICYTSKVGRDHHACRIAMILKNKDDFKKKIKKLNQVGLEGINEAGVYYGEFKLVSDSKKVKQDGDITESERNKLSNTVNTKLDEMIDINTISVAALEEICSFYVKGADIRWKTLYKDQKRKKVSLPVYPLERIRYWAEPKFMDESESSIKEIDHPLLNRCLAKSIYQDIYLTEFSADKHWVIKEHKLMGSYVLPGIAYIELAREACSRYYETAVMEIRDLVLLQPLVVLEDETKEVQTVVKKEKNHVEFVVTSKVKTDDPAQAEKWVIHAQGKAYRNDEPCKLQYNVDELLGRCKKVIRENGVVAEEYAVKSTPFTFGDRWDNMSKILMDTETSDILLIMELRSEFLQDMNNFLLHPSLLDNAVNSPIMSIDAGGVYLPFSYKSMRIYGKMPSRFYSFVRRKVKEVENLETVTFNISLLDESGKVFVEIEDYSVKRMNVVEQMKFKESYGKSNSYFETAWIGEELEDSKNALGGNSLLVFKDEFGKADILIEKLRKQGNEVIEVESDLKYRKIDKNRYAVGDLEEDYFELLKDIKETDFTRIVYMRSITGSKDISDTDMLKSMMNKGVYGLFHLIRSIIRNKISHNLELVLIADNANGVSNEESLINAHNAAVFGFGKVVEGEYSSIKCRGIDVDEHTSIDCILSELSSGKQTYLVAYRNGKRYVEEFRRAPVKKVQDKNLELKENGVYIVTGGTGGLGLEIGRYLASKNKVNLAFINRSKLPERESWATILDSGENKKLLRIIEKIKEMEGYGATVSCFSANVADTSEMKRVTDELREKYGRINGVIHCAGVAGNGFIITKEEERFTEVLNPKILGTWNLDKLTREDELDFFVMFSSITTLIGAPGQSDYTAANDFLDSYNDYRNMQSRNTYAILWPAWEETGMAFDHKVSRETGVFNSISIDAALKAFEEILLNEQHKVIPAELNYASVAVMIDQFPLRVAKQVKDDLEKYAKQAKSGGVQGKKKSFEKVELLGKGENEYSETESKLAQLWAEILGLGEIDIYESFNAMGGDSILATQLLKEIDNEYPGIVDISDVFTYPSIEEMAAYIDGKRGVSTVQQHIQEENVEKQDIADLLDNIEKGKDNLEDALEMLKRMRGDSVE